MIIIQYLQLLTVKPVVAKGLRLLGRNGISYALHSTKFDG